MKILLVLLSLAIGASGASFYKLEASRNGKSAPLSNYQGKVTLVVNVASQCGFTPQYEGLEKLYQKYREQGFVVLGFPSNDFGGQEPGSNQEIQQFCKLNYGVSFPVFDKVGVKSGDGQSPLYGFLGQSGTLPSWNFGKYLINKKGQVVKFFGSTTSPQDSALESAIQLELKR